MSPWRVQQRRRIHVLRTSRILHCRQYALHFGISGFYAFGGALLVELAQAFMTDIAYHVPNCNL